MAKRKVTNLTDVSEITCVVQKGMADEIVQSLLDAGIQGATVHSGVGTGIRERMGLLGVAVEVEREIVQVLVSKDQVDRIFERMYLAGDLILLEWLYLCCSTSSSATYIPHTFLRIRIPSRHRSIV